MRVEHLDDLPLLGDQIQRCELSTLLDTHYPDHGHWKGLSGGKVTVGWLLYILSEGDHRLSHVEDWAESRSMSLSVILDEEELRREDFCDDRLGRLLDRYSEDENWDIFEEKLGQKILLVYELERPEGGPKIIRSDSFNAPQYREPGGIIQHGFSKQRRSDLPFCKAMVSALAPLVLPLAVDILKGSGPDVDHYLSSIKRVQKILGESGNLYVGDSQLGSIGNRVAIHKAGDYYLCPLSRKQVLIEELHGYLERIKVPYKDLPSVFTEEQSKRQPGYFQEEKATVKDEQSGEEWEERRILVYSPAYAESLIKSFKNRLDKAEENIKALVIAKKGRRNPKTLDALHSRIGSILKKHKVENCFDVQCREEIEQRHVQKHKNRPEEIRKEVTLFLGIKRNKALIKEKEKRLGWQIYGTNVPSELKSAKEIVNTYRDEYRIEHLFDYMINRDVGLLPLYLKKENRVKGLIRLLSLAIRFSMLIQHQARGELAEQGEELGGIYPGNKSRQTNQPTTPMLLRALRGMSIVVLPGESISMIQMTELNETQKKILKLLKIEEVYLRVLEGLRTRLSLRET